MNIDKPLREMAHLVVAVHVGHGCGKPAVPCVGAVRVPILEMQRHSGGQASQVVLNMTANGAAALHDNCQRRLATSLDRDIDDHRCVFAVNDVERVRTGIQAGKLEAAGNRFDADPFRKIRS